MPSKTKKQAHLMSAIAHGWNMPGGKGPSRKVAEDFHSADKAQGRWEHAAGGMVKPPLQQHTPVLGASPPNMKPVSPLGQAIQNKGNAGRYAGGMGLAPARPPRVPIQGMLRNIDQKINKIKPMLKAMGGKIAAQPMPLHPDAIPVIQQALQHLKGKDASSASAVLRSSPAAMTHPHVAHAAKALQTAHGIAPATKTLTQLASQVGSASGG